MDSSSPREEAIIAAAHRRFAHYGYAKTTMDEIAGDLGMGKASLYHYFPAKESLFCAVIGREQDAFVSIAESLVAGNDRAAKKLHTYVDRRLDFFHNALILGKFSFDAYSPIRPAMNALSEEFARRELKILYAILQLGISEGEVTTENPDQHAKLFLHILQGLRFRAFRSGMGDPIEDQHFEELRAETRLATTIFLRGLHPHGATIPITLHDSPHSSKTHQV
jgi:TetR/AcrR family transcriptional repressor of mexJK operon